MYRHIGKRKTKNLTKQKKRIIIIIKINMAPVSLAIVPKKQ